jgi:hypothetical protein
MAKKKDQGGRVLWTADVAIGTGCCQLMGRLGTTVAVTLSTRLRCAQCTNGATTAATRPIQRTAAGSRSVDHDIRECASTSSGKYSLGKLPARRNGMAIAHPS